MWTENKVTRREPEVNVLAHVLSEEFAIEEFVKKKFVKKPVCHFGEPTVVDS